MLLTTPQLPNKVKIAPRKLRHLPHQLALHRIAGLRPGDSIVIYGAGPIGLMGALSARVQGAAQIFVVDAKKDRFALAEKIGCTPLNPAEGDIAERIREAPHGIGAECVGYQCHNSEGKEVPNLVLNSLIDAGRFTGHIGCVGVFVSQDPTCRMSLCPGPKVRSTIDVILSKAKDLFFSDVCFKNINSTHAMNA